ncbi:hypothetical protein CRG98_039497 [Punica granatum]|uniref:Uncharacterized protein n=1 Tax=Punica granatum TaxID=22663 RepID=A0A2I0I7Z7_PUNGR|nr:hypothetical protein CRG98_039497 [Punica granatum]
MDPNITTIDPMNKMHPRNSQDSSFRTFYSIIGSEELSRGGPSSAISPMKAQQGLASPSLGSPWDLNFGRAWFSGIAAGGDAEEVMEN